MPSTNRQKRQKRKDRYIANNEMAKKQSHHHYVQHKETVISQKNEREKTDKTSRRKHNILVQKKMATDENYIQENRERALTNANKKRLVPQIMWTGNDSMLEYTQQKDLRVI